MSDPNTDSDISPSGASITVEGLRKFVRVTDRRPNGLVAFEFAMGWPDLTAEMVLPEDLFEEFCHRHQVEFLTEAADRLGETRDEH